MERIFRQVFGTVGVALFVVTLLALADGGSRLPRPRAPGAAFFSDMPEIWPAYVRLRMQVSMKLYENEREVGSVTLKKGTRLKLLKVNPDQTLDVSFAEFRSRVDHAATDFLESLRG